MFFALPDGNGLLYALNGSADAPKPTGNIQLEVPCKMPYTEILQVSNWLRKSQRYFGVFYALLRQSFRDFSSHI